jgi:hypothetical protein
MSVCKCPRCALFYVSEFAGNSACPHCQRAAGRINPLAGALSLPEEHDRAAGLKGGRVGPGPAETENADRETV